MNGSLSNASSSDRPRLLFLCKLGPWHLNNGQIIRNYWLIDALARRFTVDVVTADDVAKDIPADYVARCGNIFRFPRPVGWRGKIVRTLGALRPQASYYTSGTVTRAMRASVKRLCETHRYSVVMTELGVIDAIPAGPLPLVFSAHNAEATLLFRRASLEPWWSRIAISIDAWRVRRLEARLIDRAALVPECSLDDIRDAAAFAPAVVGKSVVIPNGVDCATYAPIANVDGTPGVLLITGSFDWLPNRRGLLWFIDEVLPWIERSCGHLDLRIRIAGRMTSDFVARLHALGPRVSVVPNVSRMSDELVQASVVAAPVIASSGTRLRILEAWAAGRPVVTTPQGAFGLNFTDGEDLLVCSDAQAFAAESIRLLNDAALRARLRAAGLARAASYDWSMIGQELIWAFERFGLLERTVKPEAWGQAKFA